MQQQRPRRAISVRRRMKRPIPVREPEVIAADAKRYRGDDEKVATTSIQRAVLDGIEITSRYQKAHELETMIRMLENVRPEWRRQIASMWCDSKAGACYEVHLRRWDENLAQAIGRSLEQASGGHNGIYVRAPGQM